MHLDFKTRRTQRGTSVHPRQGYRVTTYDSPPAVLGELKAALLKTHPTTAVSGPATSLIPDYFLHHKSVTEAVLALVIPLAARL